MVFGRRCSSSALPWTPRRDGRGARYRQRVSGVVVVVVMIEVMVMVGGMEVMASGIVVVMVVVVIGMEVVVSGMEVVVTKLWQIDSVENMCQVTEL